MYVYGYPNYCCPVYGYQGNNDGNSGWFWAIIIVLFIIFFLFWGTGNNRNQGHY